MRWLTGRLLLVCIPQVTCTGALAGDFAMTLRTGDDFTAACTTNGEIALTLTPHRASLAGVASLADDALPVGWTADLALVISFAGTPIAESPHDVVVTAGPIDATHTSLFDESHGAAPDYSGSATDLSDNAAGGHIWAGAPTHAVAGAPLRFLMRARDIDDNPVACPTLTAADLAHFVVTLDGATGADVTCRGSLYLVTLLPHKAARTPFDLAVQWNGANIRGSPFHVTVEPGPIDSVASSAQWPANVTVQTFVQVRTLLCPLGGLELTGWAALRQQQRARMKMMGAR